MAVLRSSLSVSGTASDLPFPQPPPPVTRFVSVACFVFCDFFKISLWWMKVHALKHAVRFKLFVTKRWHSSLPSCWVWVMSLLLTKCQCYLSPSNIYATSDCHLLAKGQKPWIGNSLEWFCQTFASGQPSQLGSTHPVKVGSLLHVNVQRITTDDMTQFADVIFKKS